ncbi:MAG: IPT/TIG domain-containing protein [Planctomycetes bacterium]|nr:IPT/TIG domain-containing protein [Planctomycetota bacterium]
MNRHIITLVMLCAAFFAACEPMGTETSLDENSTDAPAIELLVTDFGSTTGGDLVVILGSGFLKDDTEVTFAGELATSVTVKSWTRLEATTPAVASSGLTDVSVITKNGRATMQNAFRFINESAPPTVTSISPTLGSTLGNTSVTIRGTNFQLASTATIGGVSLTNVEVVSLVELRGRTASSSSSGLKDVTVDNGIGSGTLSGGFTYVSPPALSLVSIAPTSGSASGGTLVELTGSGFVDGTSVSFGQTSATFVSVSTDGTRLSVLTPAGNVGAVNVTVANGTVSSSTLNSAFTYTTATSTPGAITLSGMTPMATKVSAAGDLTAGITLSVDPSTAIITGSGFVSGQTSVMFGTQAATISSVTANAISLTIPNPPLPSDLLGSLSALLAGTFEFDPADVVVTVGSNSATLSQQFTYTMGELPGGIIPGEGGVTIISLTPNTMALNAGVLTGGAIDSGLVVAIAGAGFSTVAGETTVDFGGSAAINVTVTSANLITCTPGLPSNIIGLLSGPVTVDVTVTVNGATSNALSFTYEQISLAGGTNPLGGLFPGGNPGAITQQQDKRVHKIIDIRD